jgi:CBS domain-containing membrane protein
MFLQKYIQGFFQFQTSTVSLGERLISVAGGFTGILFVMLISVAFMDPVSVVFVVASMGASAVLLFAAPHSTFSQPWPLLGGHLVSALIGVACAKFLPNPLFAAATAVGIAIGAMHFLRCIHPPGGATALVAVIGGDAIQSMGFEFVLFPVLINALIILAVAVVFNFPLTWRRYPANSLPTPALTEGPENTYSDITHADFVVALAKIDSFIDVTEHDLLQIYDLVTKSKLERTSDD